METKRIGVVLALCVVLAPLVGAAGECERQDGARCAEATLDKAVAQEQERSGYTWAELVEKIPQLKEYELGFQRSTKKDAREDDGTYMVCQRVRAPDSRIKKRACMPLNDYLAYATEQRSAAERARLDLLSRQSVAPYQTLPRVREEF